jgi:hypothetical protein
VTTAQDELEARMGAVELLDFRGLLARFRVPARFGQGHALRVEFIPLRLVSLADEIAVLGDDRRPVADVIVGEVGSITSSIWLYHQYHRGDAP